MKFLVYIFLFLFVKEGIAGQVQGDTLWFDSDWKEISKKYANFYRLTTKTEEGFQIMDNYLNGDPQMIAQVSQLLPIVKNGSCVYYYKGRIKSSQGNYKDGKLTGTWIYYYECQKDSSIVNIMEDGSKNYIRKSKFEDVFNVVEVMPEFPGGSAEMVKFIQKHVKYPKKARKKGWTGKTFLKFIVDSSGKVIEPSIMKSSGYSILDDEAIRVVGLMPNWTPGTQNNKKVSVYFNLPLNFALKD